MCKYNRCRWFTTHSVDWTWDYTTETLKIAAKHLKIIVMYTYVHIWCLHSFVSPCAMCRICIALPSVVGAVICRKLHLLKSIYGPVVFPRQFKNQPQPACTCRGGSIFMPPLPNWGKYNLSSRVVSVWSTLNEWVAAIMCSIYSSKYSHLYELRKSAQDLGYSCDEYQVLLWCWFLYVPRELLVGGCLAQGRQRDHRLCTY